jgi:hypothetical protein
VKPFLWLKIMNLKFAQELFEYVEGSLYWKSNYRKSRIGKKAGVPHSKGYVQVAYKGNLYMEHRLIFLYHHGYVPAFVDHINGVRNDNRIENLREATQSQNNYNMKTPKRNTSGVKGITRNCNNKKWRVQISINGKNKYIGSFQDIEIAKACIEQVRIKHHGEFANNG